MAGTDGKGSLRTMTTKATYSSQALPSASHVTALLNDAPKPVVIVCMVHSARFGNCQRGDYRRTFGLAELDRHPPPEGIWESGP